MPSYNKYGPSVIGDEAYAEQKAVVTSRAHKYGPAILDHPGAVAPKTHYAAGADDTLTLPEFRASITPQNTVEMLQQELGREDGARKGALQSIRKVEADGQNRPDVLEMIDNALDAL